MKPLFYRVYIYTEDVYETESEEEAIEAMNSFNEANDCKDYKYYAVDSNMFNREALQKAIAM